MEITNDNFVKKLLKEGKKATAAWAQAGSCITAEILGDAGFDAVMIDMEHGPGNQMTLIHQIHALKGQAAIPFVRAPWNDLVQIKKILDAGSYGVLVPYVNSAEQASMAVKAVRYPTEGVRGVAASPRAAHFGNNSIEYLKKANDEIFLMIAVETPEAVSQIDEIVGVEGLDGIFIGPMDLAASMGHLGNPSHPEVQTAMKAVETSVLASGKILSTVAGNWKDAEKKYEMGYQFLMLMSDTTTLSKVARGLLSQFKESYPER